LNTRLALLGPTSTVSKLTPRSSAFVTIAAAEAKPCTCPDDDDNNNETVKDTQRQRSDEGAEVEQWPLVERAGEEWLSCIQFHDDDRDCPSGGDDVYDWSAGCSGSCYDDGISTFYVNCQHQTAEDAGVDAAALMTGVQVCGAVGGFELLFLIDQLASTACLVDDAAAYMTLLQTAAPSAGCALYADSSPRIVELCTDDEEGDEPMTGNLPTAGDADDNGLQDDELPTLNNNTDETTSPDATERSGGSVKQSTTVPAAVVCPGKQSEPTHDSQEDEVSRRNEQGGEPQRVNVGDAEATTILGGFYVRCPPRVEDVGRSAVGGRQVDRDNEMTTTTKRLDDRRHEPAGGHLQRRHLRTLDTRTSAVTKYDYAYETTALLTSLHDGGAAGDGAGRQQQQQQRAPAAGQRDRHKLPELLVDRKPPQPAPVAARPSEPSSVGRGLRLPPVNVNQRAAREAPRLFPPPPPRRRSHPLERRRPTTPPNRNVLASRAVWPSMASGRPVEDEWTRRAAAMRRRTRLPPLYQTAAVANWD